jgi:SAM-dependent methyltransferase
MADLFKKLSELGMQGTLCCFINRIKLHVLRLYFRFDPWHADAPSCCRPYKRLVASHLRELPVRGVVEIGCGLGDVGNLLRNSSLAYAGLDQEKEVVAAGRFIHPRLRLAVGSFDSLGELAEPFDTLLLLNWPHGLSPKQLVALLKQVPTTFRYIVMDLIRDEAPDLGFQFRHSAEELIRNGLDVSVFRRIEHLDHVRDLVILKNERAIHHPF